MEPETFSASIKSVPFYKKNNGPSPVACCEWHRLEHEFSAGWTEICLLHSLQLFNQDTTEPKSWWAPRNQYLKTSNAPLVVSCVITAGVGCCAQGGWAGSRGCARQAGATASLANDALPQHPSKQSRMGLVTAPRVSWKHRDGQNTFQWLERSLPSAEVAAEPFGVLRSPVVILLRWSWSGYLQFFCLHQGLVQKGYYIKLMPCQHETFKYQNITENALHLASCKQVTPPPASGLPCYTVWGTKP